MTHTLKVRRFGGSLGVILPKSVSDLLNIAEGDEVFITETEEGLAITPYDPDFEAALEDARAFMKSHRDAFRALAK
ncbi:MAG: AbrB/MazE/SpoVT family DNA-binding domain-containing protein [Rhodothermales bacterium]|nr:AbrB/MazE/SpoVT family DNA-binding domain-containing protein [Rhodothermales bacterium]